MYVSFQGTIRFSISGIYPAENFFWIDETSGRIYLKRSLKEDSLKSTQYQILVEAFDDAYPENVVSEIVRVTVQRNANPPKFVQRSYTQGISETFPIGGSVLTVVANDEDGVSHSMALLVYPGAH